MNDMKLRIAILKFGFFVYNFYKATKGFIYKIFQAKSYQVNQRHMHKRQF